MKLPDVLDKFSQNWIEFVTLDHGQPTHVVLVNHPRMIREMLRRILEKTPGVEVVAEISTDINQPLDLKNILVQKDVDWIVASVMDEDRLADHVSRSGKASGLALIALSRTGDYADVIHPGPDGSLATYALENLTLQDLLLLLKSKPNATTH